MSKRITALLAAGVLALGAGTALAANETLRVIIVKTDNVAAYVQQIEKGRAMMKRLGIQATLHIWRATYAGPNTGTVVVSQEYPTWAAFAESQAKGAADPEFSAWLANLDKIRTIMSDSLYREL
jgi:hypothetical protein